MPKQKSTPKHASVKAKPKAKSAALREKELKRKKLLLLAAKAKAEHAAGAKGKGKGRLPEDVDPEEQADELAAAVEVDPDAAADEVEEEPIADRKEVKDLLEVGRQKGFLTYDEVNDALPADIVSSDQIDDVMSMFGDNDIEIVDAPEGRPAAPRPSPPWPPPRSSRPRRRRRRRRTRTTSRVASRNDPVRLYLRKMGSVSLLTREGEVEIAKRIEEGEKEVLRAAARLPAGGRGDPRARRTAEGRQAARPRGGEGRAGRGAAAESESEAEAEVGEADGGAAQLNAERAQPHRANLQADRPHPEVRRLVESCEEDVAKKKLSDVRKKELKQEIHDTRIKMMEVLEEMRLNKKQIDRIVLNLTRPHRAGGEGRGRAAADGARATAWPCASCARCSRSRATTRPGRRSWPAALNVSARPAGGAGPRRPDRGPQDQAGRGGGQPPGRAAPPQLRGHPGGRAQGRAGQGRAGRGQPAPRGVHRQEVHQPRPAVPRPDPGGQHRPDEGRRQVRVQARLQVLAPTPPGGSARPSPAPSPTRRAPSASRCT